MKQANLVNESGDSLLMSAHIFYTTSKVLGHNWALIMSDEARRTQLMTQAGYLTESQVMQQLTGRGFDAGKVYENGIGDQLKQHIVLGMVPADALDRISL